MSGSRSKSLNDSSSSVNSDSKRLKNYSKYIVGQMGFFGGAYGPDGRKLKEVAEEIYNTSGNFNAQSLENKAGDLSNALADVEKELHFTGTNAQVMLVRDLQGEIPAPAAISFSKN